MGSTALLGSELTSTLADPALKHPPLTEPRLRSTHLHTRAELCCKIGRSPASSPGQLTTVIRVHRL
ncbi:hypothetical protein EJ04DRAFT_509873 [Polyplosphaeria fusca]|uniref:Uncharacterized protein n=1 Tax=Polyplosphaeria fusca TaxID=682080 RepID=A0A9P4V2X9_9PLEO|nr:hypothetical protein EJ04DRAFT_509873 [Polyplosphaeria fusca]